MTRVSVEGFGSGSELMVRGDVVTVRLMLRRDHALTFQVPAAQLVVSSSSPSVHLARRLRDRVSRAPIWLIGTSRRVNLALIFTHGQPLSGGYVPARNKMTPNSLRWDADRDLLDGLLLHVARPSNVVELLRASGAEETSDIDERLLAIKGSVNDPHAARVLRHHSWTISAVALAFAAACVATPWSVVLLLGGLGPVAVAVLGVSLAVLLARSRVERHLLHRLRRRLGPSEG